MTPSISRKERFRLAVQNMQNRKRWRKLAHSISTAQDHDMKFSIDHCIGKGKVGTAERLQEYVNLKKEYDNAKHESKVKEEKMN